LVGTILDKDFLYHRAVTQVWAEMAFTLAESVILPMDIKGYAVYLKDSFAYIKLTHGKQLENNNATLSEISYIVLLVGHLTNSTIV